MRDIRLGKGRIIAARELLTPTGTAPGSPRVLDYDRELFTPLEMADLSNVDPSKLFTPVQFAIRVDEHLRSAIALTEQIVGAAGYSPATFGLGIDGQAESGTARRIREAKTFAPAPGRSGTGRRPCPAPPRPYCWSTVPCSAGLPRSGGRRWGTRTSRTTRRAPRRG